MPGQYRLVTFVAWMLLTGLVACSYYNALLVSASNKRICEFLRIQNSLLLRVSDSRPDGDPCNTIDSAHVNELRTLAQSSGISVPPYDATRYEDGSESIRKAKQLCNQIGKTITSQQDTLSTNLSSTSLASTGLFACILLWQLSLLQKAPRELVKQSALTSPTDVAENTIQQFSKDIGNLQTSVFRSLNMSLSGLRSTLIRSPVSIVLLKDDLSIAYANQSMLDLTATSASELMGKKFDDIVKLFGVSEFDPATLPLRNVEAVVEAKDRQKIPVEVSISGFESAHQKKYVVNIVDVSQRTNLLRARKDTLTEISHDLKTPLTSLKLILSMIVEGYYGQLPASATNALNRVLPEFDRLIRLTKNMLSADEIDNGRLTLHIEPVRPIELIDAAVTSMEGTARSKNHQIIVSVDEPELQCLIDPGRIMQVLVNLLSNAIKYSPKNSKIQINAKQSGDFVLVEILDEGPGIAKEQCERIFEKFERAELGQAGSGIGLWICRTIVELHGGTIGARARQDHNGAVFWLSLPRIVSSVY